MYAMVDVPGLLSQVVGHHTVHGTAHSIFAPLSANSALSTDL